MAPTDSDRPDGPTDEPSGSDSTLDEIRAGFRANDYDERDRAKHRLWGWLGGAGTEALIAALSDDSNRIANAAAKSLSKRGAAEAVPELVRQVARPERCIAADIVQYPYAEASDLRHDEMALALVELDDPAAVDPLIEALQETGHEWVAWEIAWVLAELGEPRALPAVESVLEEIRAWDGTGWRYRTLVRDLERADARLREAANPEDEGS